MANPVRARFILPLLAAFLLMGALASAAMAQTSAPVTQASSIAPPGWLPSTCTQNASTLATALLPPPVEWKSPLCGSCSVPACRGVTEFTLCNVGFGPGRCVVGDTCSNNTPLCTCG
jgi:hypothetical protein